MARYVCNPIEVDAYQITEVVKCEVDRTPGGKREITVKLDNGEIREIPEGMTSRMIPKEGDYLVNTHNPDEYHYLNPQHVFESKYTKVEV